MIIAITTFSLPAPITPAQAQAIFLGTAPKYLDLPGLLRKQYLLSEDGLTAGGIYHWQSRAAAEQLYTQAWRDFVRGKYGCDPLVTYYVAPVLVDNAAHAIVTDADA